MSVTFDGSENLVGIQFIGIGLALRRRLGHAASGEGGPLGISILGSHPDFHFGHMIDLDSRSQWTYKTTSRGYCYIVLLFGLETKISIFWIKKFILVKNKLHH